jgi:hypothetical protein
MNWSEMTRYTHNIGRNYKFNYKWTGSLSSAPTATRNRNTKKVLSQQTSIGYNYQDLVHVNWGWGGSSNGYYTSGAFDSNKSPISSGTKSTSDEGTSGNYQYNLEIFTNLRR